MEKYVIGLDYGSDSARAIVVNALTGETLATAVKYYPRWKERKYCNPAINQYRQHPQDYIDVLEASVKEALAACPTTNKEALAELFKIEQYVEMVLGYLRTEDMSSDLTLSCCSLDSVIRDQIHKYAGIFVSRKLSLTYEGISENVLTDEKWLEFVIGQILSNALKYTRTGGIHIYLKDAPAGDDVSNITPATPVTLVIEDTGIGIRAEDLPRIFEKGYTGVNGRESNRATGIGLYLCNKIMNRLGHRIYAVSEEGKGTKVFLEFSQENLTMY